MYMHACHRLVKIQIWLIGFTFPHACLANEKNKAAIDIVFDENKAWHSY